MGLIVQRRHANHSGCTYSVPLDKQSRVLRLLSTLFTLKVLTVRISDHGQLLPESHLPYTGYDHLQNFHISVCFSPKKEMSSLQIIDGESRGMEDLQFLNKFSQPPRVHTLQEITGVRLCCRRSEVPRLRFQFQSK